MLQLEKRTHLRISRSLALIALVGLGGPARAAPGDPVFSLGFPSAGGVATSDPGGAITSAGTFFGSVDFGGGTLNSVGIFTPDFYAAHWDSSGSHLYSYNIPHNNGFGGVSVTAIASDANGNVYIGGRIFDGDIDFGGGMLTGPNLFLLKLDSAGTHQWSATYGNGTLNAIAVSSAGVALTGSTAASVDFGGGPIASAGGSDAFVVVLDASGAHVFSAGYGDAANDQSGHDVEIDASGNVVVAGGMQGSVDFGGGPLVAAAAYLFLARFGPSGSHVWSQVIAGSFGGGTPVVQVQPYLALGSTLAVAGEMRGSVDFGGGPLTSNGGADIYVAVYDPATGAHQWSNHWGAATSEIVQALSRDASGNLLISGTMLGSFDAGGGALPYDAFSDLFLVSLDPTGAHLWSAGFGTAGSDFLAGNAVDGAGDVLLWGGAGNGIDFGGGALADAQLYLARFEGSGGGGAAVLPALGPIALLGLVIALAAGGLRGARGAAGG